MKIAVPRESAEGETRVALTPQIAGQLAGDGVEILVQAGAGEQSFASDAQYAEAGATTIIAVCSPVGSTVQRIAAIASSPVSWYSSPRSTIGST